MLLYVKFNIDFLKNLSYYEMKIYADNFKSMMEDRGYKKGEPPAKMKVVVSTELDIEELDDQGKSLNPERFFETVSSKTKRVIIITDDLDKWRFECESWYSEEDNRIVEIFHINYFLVNPTEFYLSAKIQKVEDPDLLNKQYNVTNPIEEYPLMSSYDSLVRWYDFKPDDIVKLTRTDDTIDYAIVIRTDLSEWRDSLSLYIG